MTIRRSVSATEGETGGVWQQHELECVTCGGVIVHDVVEKIGSVREQWSIERLPPQATSQAALHCPACDARLVSAWPRDARPAPATSLSADRPAHTERRTDHVCTSCKTHYVLHERIETEWRKADGGTPIASPRPYPRSK